MRTDDYIYDSLTRGTKPMKMSNRRPFHRPALVGAGSLQAVTAIISEVPSDVNLKTDIKPMEKVLPRLHNLK